MPIQNKTIFECTKCGAQTPKWKGRCLECGSWGTLTETKTGVPSGSKIDLSKVKPGKIVAFNQVNSENFPRIKTGIDESAVILVSENQL